MGAAEALGVHLSTSIRGCRYTYVTVHLQNDLLQISYPHFISALTAKSLVSIHSSPTLSILLFRRLLEMAICKHNENPNMVVLFLRKVCNPVRFKKGFNALLAFISLGYIFGFSLSQVQKFDVWGYWTSNNGPRETWAVTIKGLYTKSV